MKDESCQNSTEAKDMEENSRKSRQGEILNKLIKAKRLEGEALLMLLPESMQGHLERIGQECMTMAADLFTEIVKKQKEAANPDGEKRVKKVTIMD